MRLWEQYVENRGIKPRSHGRRGDVTRWTSNSSGRRAVNLHTLRTCHCQTNLHRIHSLVSCGWRPTISRSALVIISWCRTLIGRRRRTRRARRHYCCNVVLSTCVFQRFREARDSSLRSCGRAVERSASGAHLPTTDKQFTSSATTYQPETSLVTIRRTSFLPARRIQNKRIEENRKKEKI